MSIDWPDATGIGQLDLPERCIETLTAAKITTVGKLRSRSDSQLMALHRISPRHIMLIRQETGPYRRFGSCRLPFAKHIARFEKRRRGPYGPRKRSYNAKSELQFYGHY